MHITITPQDMRACEQAAFQSGVPSLLLMENAARAVADALPKEGRALFVCGAGNNGGDGLAAARIHALRGGRSVVWLISGARTPDAQTNLAYARALGIPVLESQPLPALEGFDVVVDALFGTGLTRAPEGETAAAIEAINQSGLPVVAVDVPSGMDGETGGIPGACIHAHTTVTFHRPKQGLYLTQKREYVGELRVEGIGLPARFDTAVGFPVYEEDDLPALLPHRARDAHKGDAGRVLLVCGGMGMAGAAAVCASACVRAGAGLTTVCCERDIMPVLQTLCPCAMCAETPKPYDALAVGCGLGVSEGAWARIRAAFDPEKPSVWDADALNMLATHPETTLGKRAVLTPHPGEAARLLNVTIPDITSRPIEAAQAIARKYGATVVLKGATSVIVSGEQTALNVVGAPGMAKGGSGDALTGILAALLVHLPPFEAARVACLWHGMAGKKAEQKKGVLQMTPLDLVDCL